MDGVQFQRNRPQRDLHQTISGRPRENPGIRQWRIVSPVAPRWKGAVFLEPAVPGRDDGVGYSGLRFIGTKRCSYEILALVSSGSGGDVYKASDMRMNRAVTVKVLPPEFAERLKNEAQTISSLKHPNICSLYDVGEQHGTGYIVTEYIEG